MTGISRRDFISAAAGVVALGGCASVGSLAKKPEPDFIWSYLAHFGVNSWKDIPLETQDPNMKASWLTRCCADHVRFSEKSWRKISAALAKAGCNQIVIDLAEIVQYPRHPAQTVKFDAEFLDAPAPLHGQFGMAGVLHDLREVNDDLVAASLGKGGGNPVPGLLRESHMVGAAARKP